MQPEVELVAAATALAATPAPHSPQKSSPGSFEAPHRGHCTLFTKHCACNEKTSRIAPSQKKAAAPKYSPPKYDSARTAGCRKRQTLYEKRLRSGQTRLIEGGCDCHSHRR